MICGKKGCQDHYQNGDDGAALQKPQEPTADPVQQSQSATRKSSKGPSHEVRNHNAGKKDGSETERSRNAGMEARQKP